MASTHTDTHGKRRRNRGPWPRSVNASDQPVTSVHEKPKEAEAKSEELLEILAGPELTPPRSRWARLGQTIAQRLAPKYLMKVLPRADLVRTELRAIPKRMQRLAN